jgi:hypothetical protein
MIMKEHPILFSGPMVRAILEGRKTQTRRVVKPQFGQLWGCGVKHGDDCFSVHVNIPTSDGGWKWIRCPYGKVGDLLWVRETFAKRYIDADRDPPDGINYRADGGCAIEPRWTPSIHMPRWASRLTLRIIEIRVQRIQDIGYDDAEREGIKSDDWKGSYPWVAQLYRDRFHELWDSINVKRAPWSSNLWVWVLTFERVK